MNIRMSKQQRTLLSPTLVSGPQSKFQVSVHLCPANLAQDIVHRILSIPDGLRNPLYAVIFMQHTANDLVGIGQDVENDKDVALELFTSIALNLTQKITEKGFFADYIDPCSGLPMIYQDKCGAYDEVQGAQVHLGYSIHNAGCCKILMHPNWRSNVYPATLFTTAPPAAIVNVLHQQFPDMPEAMEAQS